MKFKITVLSLILSLCFCKVTKAQLTLTIDTVIQNPNNLCAGVAIIYTVSGGSYNFGNVFTAQLSGSIDFDCFLSIFPPMFSNPIDIGTLPFWGSSFMLGTIPDSTTFGTYRVRIIASNPPDTSNLSPNCVIVTNLPQEIDFTSIIPNDTICQGDTINLSVIDPFALYSYLWSNEETTQSIAVTQSGSYTVTIKDTFSCESTSDTMVVTVENCPVGITQTQNQGNIKIYPNPAQGTLTIESEGGQNVTLAGDSRVLGMENMTILMKNILGESLFVSDNKLLPGRYRKLIDIGHLPPGMYFLYINSRDLHVVKRIIKE
ncbi:MAG: T9SS type A sorting domain-containing protein [Cytophagales bacterium]|nr:T9SS type A sorting domain-containing protein [Cytophagales bacterium]